MIIEGMRNYVVPNDGPYAAVYWILGGKFSVIICNDFNSAYLIQDQYWEMLEKLT